MLDQEENRLAGVPERQLVGRRLLAIGERCLAAPNLARPHPPGPAAGDVLAIIKGLVDAAGARGEFDQGALAARVERAVFGYLRPCQQEVV